MSVADEFPVGSQWRWRFGKEPQTVVGTVVMPDGAEWLIFSHLDWWVPQVYPVAKAREFWTRVVPEPKFKPGDKVVLRWGDIPQTVLAAWLDPFDESVTFFVTNSLPQHVRSSNAYPSWQLVQDGVA